MNGVSVVGFTVLIYVVSIDWFVLVENGYFLNVVKFGLAYVG